MNTSTDTREPQSVFQSQGRLPASEIPARLRWLNCETALSLGSLRGRVVLLDFFSGSGVHCAHHVADLRQLQARYSESVTVVGVHTPKFEHERNERSAAQCLQRLQIRHPVVHDADFVLWQHYAVQHWPTVVIIDIDGRVAARVTGDGSLDALAAIIEQLLEEAATADTRAFLAADECRVPESRSALSFPSRIAANEHRIYIADTGHHRIVECSHDGRIQRVFGSGNPDFLDGEGHEATFCLPQGLALGSEALYVADTGNHAIRRIRLAGGQVDTLAGIGQRSHVSARVRHRAAETALNGPIDLALHQNGLFIAMAGSHQVWRLDFGDKMLSVVAGSGKLGAGDGAPLVASFAQPSGLAVIGQTLYVSDADGSALRAMQLGPARDVRTLIGAGLFVFGDVDGPRSDARMQFPQGLAAHARGQQVYVADSYNSKIRILHAASGELRSLHLPYRLNEPGGIALTSDALWIANSGAHEIVRHDLGKASARRIAVGE